MTRKCSFACLLGILFASVSLPQAPAQPSNPTRPGSVQQNQEQPAEEDLPPEEDQAVKPKVYPFDPLEARRNIRVGNFYLHRGRGNDYRAAAGRFEDATKYDPKNVEAYFKLGEAEEKLKNKDRAREAYIKVTQLAPDSKFGKEAKRKLAGS